MNRKGLILTCSLVLVAIMAFMAGTSYGAASIRLIVNGKDIASDVPPFISGGRTFVPIRFVADALGYPVSYDSKNKTVYVGTPPEGIDLSPYEFSGTYYSLSQPGIIGGVKYSKGILLDAYGDENVSYNLGGNIKKVNFSLGIPDNTGGTSTKIIVSGDGEEISIIDVNKSELLKDTSINTDGIKQLTLKLGGSRYRCAIINLRGSN